MFQPDCLCIVIWILAEGEGRANVPQALSQKRSQDTPLEEWRACLILAICLPGHQQQQQPRTSSSTEPRPRCHIRFIQCWSHTNTSCCSHIQRAFAGLLSHRKSHCRTRAVRRIVRRERVTSRLMEIAACWSAAGGPFTLL